MTSRRQRLAHRRKSCGFTQETFAEALGADRRTVQRWERGEGDPQPWQRPRIAEALQLTLTELDELLTPDGVPPFVSTPAEANRLPFMNATRGEAFAQAIRETSRRLVILDNELNGLPVAEMAARAFKGVHRRLGEADYDQRHERDIRSAAAELAEVAGWALFDAERHSAARRFNQEALFLAQLSGDRTIELLILQNMAMVAGWLGRPREELAIARSVLENGRLSPRVEAIFRVREARGLFSSGDESEGRKAFALAHALLGDGERAGDPFWTWWITDAEIEGHHGFELQQSGNWRAAIPRLESTIRRQDSVQVGYQNIYAVRLLSAYVGARAWADVEDLAESIVPLVAETSSVRTLNLLDKVTREGEQLPGAPGSVRDALSHVRDAISEDPYEL